jgi:hypothetical protein
VGRSGPDGRPLVADLDPAEAREHIEMVERIIAASSQRLCSGGEYFVIWGLYAGLATVGWQLVINGALPAAAMWYELPLLLAAIAFSVFRGRASRLRQGRHSLLQREFLNILWLTVGVAFVTNVAAFRIFSGWAQAAVWSFAETIVLLYIGLHGNRRAQVCGALVLISMIAANFVPPSRAGFVLAAGMVAGYAGFGIAELLARE